MLLNAATVFDSKGKPTGGWNDPPPPATHTHTVVGLVKTE